ncbi:MAG: ankyrin repeat domain-containing protein [Treponema sp.]|nr:ankyrin repeat domain-containing protein [Treponema sp.]
MLILIVFPATSQNATSLMIAAKNGNDWQVMKLLNSGVDIQERDSEGWTALMYAVRYQQDSHIVKLLIDNGAHIRVRNSYNFTPLLIASLYTKNPDILAMMLKDRNGAEEEVFYAFILSIVSNEVTDDIRYEKITLFFNKEISINAFWNGMTPLMYACKYCSTTAIIKQLIDNGALTSVRDKEGKTAFDYAQENQSLLHDEIYWSLTTNRNAK